MQAVILHLQQMIFPFDYLGYIFCCLIEILGYSIYVKKASNVIPTFWLPTNLTIVCAQDRSF